MIGMDHHSLLATSPIDGRYAKQTELLRQYFSEFAIIRYRIWVEVEYFIALCELPLPQLAAFPTEKFGELRELYLKLTPENAIRVKEIEKETNHDVKAIEYYIKERLKHCGIDQYLEFIHFGLTSQDLNNTAFPAALRDSIHDVYLPLLEEIITDLRLKYVEWADVPMLARTHGQPASPTRLGKEVGVFVERLNTQVQMLKQLPFCGKFGGATGNFNAHFAAYPKIDWVTFANRFLNEKLNLQRLQTTTQISHYDDMSAQFDNLVRINNILIDLCRDFWIYISMDYFKQRIKKGEVGSSAMPHKVNPIDFENAEGNLGLANALFTHLSQKLPISRLQRDLTDSTVIRNIGVPLAHSLIALKSLQKGLSKIIINFDKINQDLENNWSVVAEGIQTILRRENYPNPYEALKALTRTNQKIDQHAIHDFIQSLDVSDSVKKELMALTPKNYLGIKPQ